MPPQRPNLPELRESLRSLVAYNASVYGWDKTVKNLSYGLPLAASLPEQIHGEQRHAILRGPAALLHLSN